MKGTARWSIGRLLLTILLSVAAWAVIAVGCLMVGSTGSFGWPKSAAQLDVRREVVLTASLVGAALAAAGVAYQAILRNPLADPYLLGASSGASLAAYLWRLPFLSGMIALSGAGQAISQQSFAFAGALVSVAIVFVLARSRGRLEPLTLLLVGVIVNAVNGSIFLFVDAIHKGLPAGEGPLTFLVGAIQTNLTAAQFRLALSIIALGVIVLLYVSGELNVAALDDVEAESMGVRIERLRWIALVAASLVTAAAVAISGPIGFVGLVCPHVARLIVGRDQRVLLPASAALGAGLLAVGDAVSRKLSGGGELGTILPVGVLTGLLGGPFFLVLLWQGKRGPAGRR
jgi:iron complex transport system permease protein